MIRVCLDTNILISSIFFGGKPKEILDLGDKNQIVLVTSPQILAELRLVLSKKFRWSESEIKQALKTLTQIMILVSPTETVNGIKHGPDNRILECALAGKADYIVSGDKKHLLPLSEFEGIKIITASQLLKVVRDS